MASSTPTRRPLVKALAAAAAVLVLAGGGYALWAAQPDARPIETSHSGCPGRMQLDAQPAEGFVLVAAAPGQARRVPVDGTEWVVQVGGEVFRGSLAQLAKDGSAPLAHPQGPLTLRYVEAQAPAAEFNAGDRFEVVGATGVADLKLMRGMEQAAGLLSCM